MNGILKRSDLYHIKGQKHTWRVSGDLPERLPVNVLVEDLFCSFSRAFYNHEANS